MIIGKTRTNQPVESDAGLDAKLVNLPLPATSGQGGKVLGVNSGGTAYELKDPRAVNEVLMENVVDADGHSRFVEDNMTTPTTTGLNITYAKWSLSGTHLMLVVAGSIDAGTGISASQIAETDNLPAWVLAKIYPSFTSYIEYKGCKLYDTTTGQATEVNVFLRKPDVNKLTIEHDTIVANPDHDVGFRFAFDLLIDAE